MDGGYLFSVVNPDDTIVQFGIRLTPTKAETWYIELLYTDAKLHTTSQILTTFEVPANGFLQFLFKVINNKITFYQNCNEMDTVLVKRIPDELIFQAGSTLYIAQAGSKLKGYFEVREFIIFAFFFWRILILN